MDVLSEVLKVVKLTGAVFYNVEFSAPWSVWSAESKTIAQHLAPGARHLIVYHLVTEGSAWAGLESGPRVKLTPGDIVVFPHGDPHVMGNGSPARVLDNDEEMEWIRLRGLEVARVGGGGEITKVICGYMSCEPELGRMLLGALPPLLKVNIRNDTSGQWLENSIRFSVDQAASSTPGAEVVLAKLSEVLFIETLRRYVATIPAGESGWLSGARDAEVGKALALLHRQTAHPWTIAELADQVGVSRSVLAERFRQFVGEPPIAYLTKWRLHLAARALTTTSHSVAEIGMEVGYDSEAAFNRAFKRQFGHPPARYRKLKLPAAAEAAAAGPRT
jgi:AraC-like DNA-binding protein